MKVRSLIFSMLCLLAMGTAVTACSDDDDDFLDDTGSKVTLPQTRMYILNEGSWNANNSGIAFYAPKGDADFIGDIFKKQNGVGLGDTGQSMIEYGDEIYVAVWGSNYLLKLNAACVEQKRVEFANDAELSGGIRYIDAEDGYIYASFYGGVVAKINARTLEVEKKLSGLGGNLEGVAICEDMLYVANTHAGDYLTYYKDVFVIDLNTFTLKETLEVTINPNVLMEEDDKVFLISWEVYGDPTTSYMLQVIEPHQNNKVTPITKATKMAEYNDRLYLIYSYYQAGQNNEFFTYNIKTGEINRDSFLKDVPAALEGATIYMFEINENNGDIYIGTTDYTTNGTIYRFRADGTFVDSFDAGGISPSQAIFFN